MDIVGAALPNVMFIVGILAIGLGLGIELKVVSLNKEIDRTGRIGAFVVGIVLIGASVVMYLNPSIAKKDTAEVSTAQVVGVATQPAAATPAQAPVATQAVVAGEGQAPTARQVAGTTQAPAPSTAVPAAAPAQVAIAGVAVPNLHGLSDKDAQEHIKDAGLLPRKAERCAGADQADPKAKKGRVMCQNPPAGEVIASGAAVEYVLAGK